MVGASRYNCSAHVTQLEPWSNQEMAIRDLIAGSNGIPRSQLNHPNIRSHYPTTSHWSIAAPGLIAMGFWDTVTDLVEAATPWSAAQAEAPPPEDKVWQHPRLVE
jgi:hypothetical protein